MTIRSEAELAGMRRARAVVRDVLRELERRVERGDLVKLDLVATQGGFVADSAVTGCVPPARSTARLWRTPSTRSS